VSEGVSIQICVYRTVHELHNTNINAILSRISSVSSLLRFKYLNSKSTRNQRRRNDWNNCRKWTCCSFLTPHQILKSQDLRSENANCAGVVVFARCLYCFYNKSQESRCSGLSVSLLWPDPLFSRHQMTAGNATLHCEWNRTGALF